VVDVAVGVGLGADVVVGTGAGSVLSDETPGAGAPGIVPHEVRRISLEIKRTIQRR